MVAMATVWAEGAVNILSMQKTGPLRSLSGFKMAVRERSDWAFIYCDDSMKRHTTEALQLYFIWILEQCTGSGKR